MLGEPRADPEEKRGPASDILPDRDSQKALDANRPNREDPTFHAGPQRCEVRRPASKAAVTFFRPMAGKAKYGDRIVDHGGRGNV
jgi:hypothetical protein